MGWFEDSIEEFKKLPTAGKVAVGGAAVGVAILAYASYRANAGSASAASTTNGTGTTGTGADSALTGLGVPSLASSPADWQNWFSNGLTIPQTASDGAPASATGASGGSTSAGGVTYTPPAASVASAASSVQTAAAHVTSSVSAPPPPPPPPPPPAPSGPSAPIQNPTAAQTAQHTGTQTQKISTFIPTTIRPIAPPPGTISGGRAI